MKNYIEKNFDLKSLKGVDIQRVGGYVNIADEGFTEKGKIELGMNDESGLSCISYNDIQNEYIADYSAIDYNSYYFDELEWQEFVNNLMNYKQYNHFLVVAFNSRWDGASGYKIYDNYKECFTRDYECSQYVVNGSLKGKVLIIEEYSHDVPMGHLTAIIGLTNAEYEKLDRDYDTQEVIDFGKKYIDKVVL